MCFGNGVLEMSAMSFGLDRMVRVLLMLTFVMSASLAYSDSSVNIDKKKSVLDSLTLKPSTPSHTLAGKQKKADRSLTLTEIWCSDIDDESTRESCWESYKSSFNYYKTGHAHRVKVFAWQHLSARIIFFVVLILVATGIYFAWVQFKLDIRPDKNTTTGGAKGHTVELSASGIKVSSPVLGVIILVLSLAFFYLYLVFVYPITEII